MRLSPTFRRDFILVILAGVLFAGCEARLFYRPRPYPPETLQALRADPRLTALPYVISSGPQVCFYRAPRAAASQPPPRLWVLFGGLTSLALDWLPWFDTGPDPQSGLLLVDYPGYGLGSGRTRDHLVAEIGLTALDALAEHLGVGRDALAARTHLLGHSFGCAAALQLAVKVPVKRLVLIAPFTSLADMSCLRYGAVGGSLIHLLLFERYDNRRRLAELAQRRPPPPIVFIHGGEDRTVPAWMGRELADGYPATVAFHEIPGQGHRDIIRDCLPLIRQAMGDPPTPHASATERRP